MIALSFVPPPEIRAAIRQAAPAAILASVRWLLTLVGGVLVAHGIETHAQLLDLVATGAPAISAWIWSAGQKVWAAYHLRLAIEAPEGLARPPPPSASPPTTDPKDTPMATAFDFSKFAAAAKAELQKLAPEVAEALPAEFAGALDSALGAVAEEATSVVNSEIETATHLVPPALQPFAPAIEELIDSGIKAAQTEADAKIASLTAAKASLQPTAPAAEDSEQDPA